MASHSPIYNMSVFIGQLDRRFVVHVGGIAAGEVAHTERHSGVSDQTEGELSGLPLQFVAIFVTEDDAHPSGNDVVSALEVTRALSVRPRRRESAAFDRKTGNLMRNRSIADPVINAHRLAHSKTKRTGTRSPFSSICITSERLLSEGSGTCAGPYYTKSFLSVGHEKTCPLSGVKHAGTYLEAALGRLAVRRVRGAMAVQTCPERLRVLGIATQGVGVHRRRRTRATPRSIKAAAVLVLEALVQVQAGHGRGHRRGPRKLLEHTTALRGRALSVHGRDGAADPGGLGDGMGWYACAGHIAMSTTFFRVGKLVGVTVVWAAMVVVWMLYSIPGLYHTCVFWGVR